VDFRHPIGIVIGDGVKIGDNVKIWHNVTIGSHGKANEDLGYPTIEKNVRIYEGATIIGKIVIGENSLIGSKSLVNKDVPQDSTAFGIPAKIKFNANLS
jgi:serine O-acetyltransferase